MGSSKQWRDAALSGSEDDAARTGLSHLDRSAASGRTFERQRTINDEHVFARHGSRLQWKNLSRALPELEFTNARRRAVGARRSRGAGIRRNHSVRQRQRSAALRAAAVRWGRRIAVRSQSEARWSADGSRL